MNLRGYLSVARSIKSALHRLAIFIFLPFLFPGQINAQTHGSAIISIESASGSNVLVLGDTATFDIMIDTRGEDIYGSSAYLSIPDSIFTLVFDPDAASEYVPFIPGDWINGPSYPNSTFTDSLGQELNGIPGIQYNYSQSSLVGGNKSTRKGKGVLAQFRLAPHTIPDNPAGEVTLSFDNWSQGGVPQRETRYQEWPHDTPPYTMESWKYAQYLSLTVTIAGAAIFPAIPDTNLTPGDNWIISLDDHFTSGVYAPGDSGVVWSQTPINTPAGANVIPDWPNRQIDITTIAGTHGTIEFDLFLSATGIPGNDFADTQRVTITVDHLPVFDQPLSDPFLTFDEDTQSPLPANAALGGVLFTDLDDNGSDIMAWLVPDTQVHLTYDDINTITFFADTNWYGDHSARLYIQDALGISINTLLTFTVNPVNDAPVVDLDSVGVLLDTVIIHYGPGGGDTLALADYISDVDNPYGGLDINATSLVDTIVSAILFSGDSLVLATVGSVWYGDVSVEVTATDNEPLTGRDTLIVRIEPWPPEIVFTGPIKIDATPGGPADTTLNLADWVNDPDTPPLSMTWSFRALDTTLTVDPNISFSLLDTFLTISAPSGYRAIDLVEMTVTNNDIYGLTDVDTVLLYVFDTFAPLIALLPDVTIYRDTSVQVLDLDDYVADLVDSPADISWSASWQGQLYRVTIGADHVVTIATNPLYFGPDTVTFIATNTSGYKDTSQMAVRVIPRSEQPPVWEAMPEFVEIVWPDTIPLFIITDMVRDDFLPSNQLIYASYTDPDTLKPLIVIMDTAATYQTSIAVPGLGNYSTWLYFTAEDTAGNISPSDTIRIIVRDSYSPVWRQLPTVRMGFNETHRDTLSKYLSDRDTPLSSLAITVIRENSLISTTYDPVTMELVIQSQSKGPSTYITLIANDGHVPIPNTATARFKVIIEQPEDRVPPEGTLTYFFNPVADRWINYVLVGDSTVVSMKPTYIKDHKEVGLTFIPQDTLPGAQSWRAPKEFTIPGAYSLTVDLFDAANPVNILTLTLNHTVALSKATGDVLTSPDGKLTLAYPALPISEGKLVILAEESLSADLAKQLGVPGDEHLPDKLYALDANLPEPVSMTLSTRLAKTAGAYYAFYEVSGDQRTRIETQTDGAGLFEADIVTGRDFVFAASEVRAEEGLLPYNELRLYPNPFNATLQVRFKLRTPEKGRITIYNILGKEVFRTPQESFNAGVNAFQWQGLDQRGRQAPSGLYFIRLVMKGGTAVTRKVMLLK